MRSFIGSESIIDDLYETICRIVADGGDPNDQETWDRYYAETQPYWVTTEPEEEAEK